MENYNWAIKVTTELLDGNGGVEDTRTEVRECRSERDARARHEAIQDTLANPHRRHPKWQRISASKLIRQPVGEWEEVA